MGWEAVYSSTKEEKISGRVMKEIYHPRVADIYTVGKK